MKRWLKTEIMVLSLLVGSMLMTGCKTRTGEKSAPGKTETASSGSSEVLARVGDIQITVADFEAQLSQQNPLIRARFDTPEQKKKLLDSLVEREVLALESKRLGLEKDPEVQNAVKRLLAAHLVRSEFNNKRAKELTVPDADMERYYQENIARFKAPEKVRVQQVLYETASNNPARRKIAKAQAQEALTQIRAKPHDQALFDKITHGAETTITGKPTLVDTTFKDREQLQQEFGKALTDAAFGLKQTNDLTGLMENEKGVYFLRLSGRQAAIDSPYDKVKEQIRNTLLSKVRMDAFQAYVEELKRKVGVQVFENVLATVKSETSGEKQQNPTAPPPPAAMPENQPPKPPMVPDKPAIGDKPSP